MQPLGRSVFPLLSFLSVAARASFAAGQQTDYSAWMAYSILSREQGIVAGENGVSELLQAGFTQKAFHRLIEQYPDDASAELFEQYIAKSVGSAVGTVKVATEDTSYPLDRLSNGNNLIRLYEQDGNETYRQAFEALRQSINLQKRNAEGGYFYYVYPYWSYLDGMYSLTPFYAYYTVLYDIDNSTAVIEDIMLQLDLLWHHCYNSTTGLLFHGYDASKTAVWANPVTGASPHVWGRSLGWYTMALVDTLEILPISRRSKEWRHLQSRFQQLAGAVVGAVDPESGGWWQVLDQPGRAGNYIESSGSAMFVYCLLKGVRLGYLQGTQSNSTRGTSAGYRNEADTSYTGVATRAYDYLVDTFVVNNGNGTIDYNGTVSVCSLNSTASYEYYIGQPISYNSVLGSAAFVLASLEYESHVAGLGK